MTTPRLPAPRTVQPRDSMSGANLPPTTRFQRIVWLTCLACFCGAVSVSAEPGQSVKDPASSVGTTASTITPDERLDWFVESTIGVKSLLTGIFSAGMSTWVDQPHEYGPHWSGFAKRYGMRLTGVSVGNAMEAGLGHLWGEDPRYLRAGTGSFMSRVGHAGKLTVLARRGDGLRPAYARYAAVPGNNFISNAWRAPSASSVNDALLRTALGFSGRFAGNLFEEFWPDIRRQPTRPNP